MKIDGRLDEEMCRTVSPITEFIQQVPRSGVPITERTEAWVLFDDEKIYVMARCWDSHPERIVANDMRRGSANLVNQDNVAVAFDTFHDRRNSFLFYTTPIGGMREAAVIDEKPNHDWRAIWEGSAVRFEGGWTVEMAFPFKSLRYNPGREQTWGIQLRRRITSKNENGFLTIVDPAWGNSAINHPAMFATLVGLEAPPAAQRRTKYLPQLDRSAGRPLHQHRRRRAHDLHREPVDVRRRARPVQLEPDVALDEPPISLEISTGQRTLRRLHRRPLDIASPRHRSPEPRSRPQDQSTRPLLAPCPRACSQSVPALSGAERALVNEPPPELAGAWNQWFRIPRRSARRRCWHPGMALGARVQAPLS